MALLCARERERQTPLRTRVKEKKRARKKKKERALKPVWSSSSQLLVLLFQS
jgi:hypothetical protein